MLNHPRYLRSHIVEDLETKMVFIGGPRQVGKTTLALSFLDPSVKTNPAYLNWDFDRDRSRIMNSQLPFEEKCMVLDEIHKYPRWRNLIKGAYDKYGDVTKFLITGSAKLDHFRKGGDSLLGRYFYYRLHPISLMELDKDARVSSLEALMNFGGFPEPLARGDMRFYRRWAASRLQKIIREDLRDLEQVREISLIEALVDTLPSRVSSPLSIRPLSQKLEVAHESVESWITILENLYLVFRISPYQGGKIDVVKERKKLYFWDWCQASSQGQRFENLIASHLLKYCHYLEDTEGFKMELRYLLDVKGREIDFVVLKNRKPLFGVECKVGEKNLAAPIKYFSSRSKIPLFYQVHLGDTDYYDPEYRCRVLPFGKFCKEAGLV